MSWWVYAGLSWFGWFLGCLGLIPAQHPGVVLGLGVGSGSYPQAKAGGVACLFFFLGGGWQRGVLFILSAFCRRDPACSFHTLWWHLSVRFSPCNCCCARCAHFCLTFTCGRYAVVVCAFSMRESYAIVYALGS